MFKYNPNYAPIARIVLRYVAGGGALGSERVGELLATDPDVVMITSIAIAAVVEGLYAIAKRKGMTT